MIEFPRGVRSWLIPRQYDLSIPWNLSSKERYFQNENDRTVYPALGMVLPNMFLLGVILRQFCGMTFVIAFAQVDDKYEYSCESKDIAVHGWISSDPPIGFWQITPSIEFRSGGPSKQFLTSHVGPTSLNVSLFLFSQAYEQILGWSY